MNKELINDDMSYRHFTNKNIFQLGLGQFSPCSIKWNDKTNSFEKNTLEEVYECCHHNCDKFLKICKDKHKCKSDNECISCDTIQDICSKNCFTPLQTDEYDHIINCIYNYCNPNDIECMKKEKEKLLECCNARCVNTDAINCDKYCNLLVNSLLELAEENKQHTRTAKFVNKQDDYTLPKIIIGILIGFIGIILLRKIIHYIKLN